MMKKKNSKVQEVYKPKRTLKKEIWRYRELYLFMLPAIVAVLIFSYGPMYGLLMAFQDVKLANSILSNEWVGLYNFKRFFNSTWMPITIRNTVMISLLGNIVCWPFPLMLALLLHNCTIPRIRKIVQSVTYLPNLLSVVVVVNVMMTFCSGSSGLINILLTKFGFDMINFMGEPNWVYPLYCISGVWQGTGYGAVIYLGALSSVDQSLEEAAKIDGASKLQRIWHIQIPTILPTIVTLVILEFGSMFSVGADKMLLMQTDLNLTRSELVSTYVYKVGLTGMQYGFSTAVGLMQNMINMITLFGVNWISKKLTNYSVL